MSESAIREALADVEAGLAGADVEIVIDNLFAVSNLLEYVISGECSGIFLTVSF
jgi:hypothetical protein